MKITQHCHLILIKIITLKAIWVKWGIVKVRSSYLDQRAKCNTEESYWDKFTGNDWTNYWLLW